MDNFFIFGDVHGEAEKLSKLIDYAKEEFGDVAFYSLGDLIDRGPDSKGVFDLCIENNVSLVMGNHEQWLYDLITLGQFESFALEDVMGGVFTFESFGVNISNSDFPSVKKTKVEKFYNSLTPKHIEFIKSAKPYLKITGENSINYWLCHSGLSTASGESIKKSKTPNLSDQQIMDLIASDRDTYTSCVLWPSNNPNDPKKLFKFDTGIQIFGHRPVPLPIVESHFIAMDTGCGTVYPYRLSGIHLPSGTILNNAKT